MSLYHAQELAQLDQTERINIDEIVAEPLEKYHQAASEFYSYEHNLEKPYRDGRMVFYRAVFERLRQDGFGNDEVSKMIPVLKRLLDTVDAEIKARK